MAHPGWALLIVLSVALLTLCWHLGSSSLFVDEVASWRAAHVPLGELFHRVRIYELAPPTYYLVLHAWISLFGSDSESVMRALSVVAGIGTVGGIYWIGNLIAGRRVAVLSAFLLGVSPLFIEYGQQVRAYSMATFAGVLAVAAVLQALKDPASARRWLVLAAAASGTALWLHYTTAFVVVPLTVFTGSRKELDSRARWGFVAFVAAAAVLLVPELRAQLHEGNQDAVAGIAQLGWVTAERVFGAPFDRTYNILSPPAQAVGAVLVVASVVIHLLAPARIGVKHPRLLAALASCAPIALLIITLAHQPEMISRYAAVAAPFMVLSIAAVLPSLPRVGWLPVAGAFALALPASVAAHSSRHYYPNTRAALKLVGEHWHRNESVAVGIGYPALPFSTEYYAIHLLPRGAAATHTGGWPFFVASVERKVPAVALITAPIATDSYIRGVLSTLHYSVIVATRLAGPVPIQVLVADRR